MFTEEKLAAAYKIGGIFMPSAMERREDFIKRDGRYVHYTSAASGLAIVNSKEIWMRNATCMADFREIQHGFEKLDQNPKTREIIDLVNRTVPEVGTEAVNLFNSWWNDTRFGTYVASISEHWSYEDQHGRLSMWRGFARSASARVALVFKIPTRLGLAQSLNVTLSPVAYFTDDQISAELSKVAAAVQANATLLQSTDRQLLVGSVFYMLMNAVVCLKHEGFSEEEEWRAIYAPNRMPSPLMRYSIETIDGVPQKVYKIPLQNGPTPDLAGLSLPEMLDRIIIGPSNYPWAMYEAFVAALSAAGVPDAANRVVVSGIPIRT